MIIIKIIITITTTVTITVTVIVTVIGNSNSTEWRTIQGVIAQVINFQIG